MMDERNENSYISNEFRGKFSNKKQIILVSLAILLALIISIISISLYTKMENRQETLNSEIQILTQHLRNLTNLSFKYRLKISMLDQLQKNYSENLQQRQSKQNQTALQYSDSGANLTQQLTQSKNHISTLVENQQNLLHTVQQLVQEQSILQHFNSSELSETLIKVESLKNAFYEVGWFTAWNGYKYKVLNSPSSWWDARRECQSYGGDLAAPGVRNMNIRRFIKSFISDKYLWVGLNDIDHEGRYVWIDGVNGTTDNIDWNSGEPNNKRDEDCCMIWHGRNEIQMNDYYCTDDDYYYPTYGLCEKPLNKY